MSHKRLVGRSALVTGGAGGCGAEASRLFAQEGAKVTIADIQQEAGEKLAEAIRAEGGEASFVHTDVSKRADVEAAV
ncbi:MAG: SDR family NAD(P)-dependent oxidoreductase, partial [Rhodospirillales bacterium]|nr:SDR family NAD(P)-dependent oxidoreductase [Rhodospirillales bacterium]